VGDWFERALPACTTAWPGLAVDPEGFRAYVLQRLGSESAAADGRWADLYLACACARGDSRAIAALETHYFPRLRGALARVAPDPAAREDAEALLRRHLFVAEGEASPKIAEYSGKGDLAGWLRIIAVRVALRSVGRKGREVPAEEDALLAFRAPVDDPELELAKQQCRDQFKQSFCAALKSLESRDRNLLRYHYIDELSTEEVAALFHVHRATAVRWLAAARHQLLEATRAQLARRLGADRLQMDSMMRLIRSRLHLSLSKHWE
jgi:RNA polymerase sigma-70 factor (ECF subfamily)